mmetsp:Transcript_80882/g.193980  ORF Transcript_80882/g.193980 Transcript_80882/m.193980 type:complete len:200 (-) Transcript_80882:230-829(-)
MSMRNRTDAPSVNLPARCRLDLVPMNKSPAKAGEFTKPQSPLKLLMVPVSICPSKPFTAKLLGRRVCRRGDLLRPSGGLTTQTWQWQHRTKNSHLHCLKSFFALISEHLKLHDVASQKTARDVWIASGANEEVALKLRRHNETPLAAELLHSATAKLTCPPRKRRGLRLQLHVGCVWLAQSCAQLALELHHKLHGVTWL